MAVVKMRSIPRENFSAIEIFYQWEKTGRFAQTMKKYTFRRQAEIGYSY
jgi:hypothetical protein